MRILFLRVMAANCVVACLCAFAGVAPGGDVVGRHGRPAGTNLPGHPYPQVDDDRRATFRISAPEARDVQVSLADRYEMTRDRDGVWAVTTRPLAPGFHYYAFVVDGVALADPASEGFFGTGRTISGIEVPSPDEEFYQARNVPHGEVRVRTYPAKSTRGPRKVLVYTPPDYDPNPTARYPVLYLLHDVGEDRRAWWRQGRVNFILDNLIADGKAKPMLVVMGDDELPVDVKSPATAPGENDRPAGQSAFEQVAVNELIPLIDATYRTVADREHRAIAGTGQGGGQALRVGLSRSGVFAHIGGFSPEVPAEVVDRAGRTPAGIDGRATVLFLSAGAVELGSNREIKDLHTTWDRAGVRHVYYESPGTAREWLTWRRSLREFAPLLFWNETGR